jgi:hypothetical protein
LAFGLAERWVARFAAAGITPAPWFTGNTSGTDYLTFTSTVNSVSTSPTTVSSSTGSPSSGGGGGGGGGSSGGGGVGSW